MKEDEKSKSGLVKDKKNRCISVSVGLKDLEILGMDTDTITSRDACIEIRKKLGLPLREQVGRTMSEFTAIKMKLGLDKKASDRELLNLLKKKGVFA